MFPCLKKYFFLFTLFYCFTISGQDTLRYRSTSFHGSVSDFILLSPKYTQTGSFYPSALLSLKSSRADSFYWPLKKLGFSIMMGVAASRYLFFDEKIFVNIIDKSPYHVLSKRFFGGFGVNFRRQVSKNIILDVDLAPILHIIIDKSEETKTDTSGWNSVAYENIYQGLHLFAYCKAEYKMKGKFVPFISFSASLPLIHALVRNPGDDPYHNIFKGQLFLGIGVSCFYRTRHIIEPDDRNKVKK